MDGWTNDAFVMLAPDAIRRGLAGRVVEYFEHAGLRPVRWALGEVTAIQADAMLGSAVASNGEAYRYRCLDTLFGLGPCLMFALRAVDQGFGSVHERALAIRGASTAKDLQAGSIRHDLRATNRIMSLLHVSDGPEEAAVESAILVPTRQGSGRVGAWRDAAELPGLLHVLACAGHETRDFIAVRRDLRANVLARTWADMDSDLRVAATRLVAGEGTPGNDLDSAFEAAHPAATVLALSLEQPVDLTDVERRLASIGITLDDWQRAVITTSMYFPPW